jgi:hypothetical protein
VEPRVKPSALKTIPAMSTIVADTKKQPSNICTQWHKQEEVGGPSLAGNKRSAHSHTCFQRRGMTRTMEKANKTGSMVLSKEIRQNPKTLPTL